MEIEKEIIALNIMELKYAHIRHNDAEFEAVEDAKDALRSHQERETPVGFISTKGYGVYLCGACKRPVHKIDAYCKHCGRRLKEAQDDGRD